MSAVKWIPDDAELDAVARTLPASEPAMNRAEQNRTRMLAGAASVAQHARSSRMPFVAVGLSIAAAAAALLWFVGRSDDSAGVAVSEHVERVTIVASNDGQFDRTATWPDYQMRVHTGRVSFTVGPVHGGERFRVIMADSEIEVRGARFVVEARQDRLLMVLVEEGTVEIRKPSQDPVTVKAGERWSPPQAALVDDVAPADDASAQVAPKDEPISSGSAAAPSVAPVASPNKVTTRPKIASRADPEGAPKSGSPVDTVTARKPSISVEPAPPQSMPVKPSEAEFRRGWTLLRAGDAGGASKLFAKACNDVSADAREDACYWTGVAAKRAGQTAIARDALAIFISAFPSSARTGEAAALLGWLLYDDGDLDGAERRFRTGAKDRVPSVRESAERGLTAIERRRKMP